MSASIGFDFDKSIAHAYSLTPFILLLEVLIPRALAGDVSLKNETVFLQKSRLVFYKAVADNEVLKKGVVFRPSLLQLLPKYLQFRAEGKINKLFIYSNNRSKEVINVMDYILGLVLQKSPYNVSQMNLIKDTDGFMHVLSPRFHLDAACRSSEGKDSSGFREKGIEGIQACLGENILETDLWYIDDTRYHTRLMNQIKENYVNVEPYEVHLSNKDVVNLFLQSYPRDAFKPNTRIGALMIKSINRIMPGFEPTGTESRETLAEKLTKVLKSFSPDSGGRVAAPWKDSHVNSDKVLLEKGLQGVLRSQETSLTNQNKPLTYVNPIGGRRRYRYTRKKRVIRKKTRKALGKTLGKALGKTLGKA
jgi:hypothetical protein